MALNESGRRESDKQKPGLARCAEHGLTYDPRHAEGCVICRRGTPNERRREDPTKAWAVAAALVLGAALITYFLHLQVHNSFERLRYSPATTSAQQRAEEAVRNAEGRSVPKKDRDETEAEEQWPSTHEPADFEELSDEKGYDSELRALDREEEREEKRAIREYEAEKRRQRMRRQQRN